MSRVLRTERTRKCVALPETSKTLLDVAQRAANRLQQADRHIQLAEERIIKLRRWLKRLRDEKREWKRHNTLCSRCAKEF